MTFRELQIFIVVASRLNLKDAAQELGISQPSISEQLRLLRQELGKDLYRKVAHGIELTPAGTLLLKEAKSIFSRLTQLRAKLHSKNAGPIEPSLTLGGCYSASNELLPSLLASFKKTHPDVQINLQSGTRADLERMVLSGDGDLAVIHELPSNAQLAAELLDSDPVITFVGANHPLARKRHLDWNDIGRFGFIVRGPHAGPGVISRYRASLVNKAKLKVIMQCNSPAAVKTAVIQNRAIGMLFRGSIANDIKIGHFKKIRLPGPQVKSTRYVIYRRNRPLSVPAKGFIRLLQNHRRKVRFGGAERPRSAQGK